MTDDDWEDLLEAQGFESPCDWVDFARSHGFRREPATRLDACPHCGTTDADRLGSYVYYSNFALLLSCPDCGLCYSNLRLRPATVRAHFERAYKDEEYFRRGRRPILRELATIVARRAPPGARVLDVGGAKGHLLARLRDLRPDLALTLSDLSPAACVHAREKFGLEAVNAGVRAIASSSRTYDVVILSDVIYYEPDLASVWGLLESSLGAGGQAVVRVPNKSRWIRMQRSDLRQGAEIQAFNPEHLYVFTREFLESQFRRLGFDQVQVRASRLLGDNLLAELSFHALRIAGSVLPGGPFTPAMVVIARRPPGH
jgi:SAM-dependent methyltransferase